MPFAQFSSVSLAFGDRDILLNASINLAAGTKAALTGANGAGKSTLLKVMAGLIPCDSGQCIKQKDSRIGYLPQSGLTHRGLTLMAEADTAFTWGYEIQRRIDKLGELMAAGDGEEARLAEEQATLIAQLEDSGFHRREEAIQTVLLGLGFKRQDMGRRTEEFSGGWQMRIALAKVLLTGADILLLDEPTNYLDLEARTWLEGFLAKFKGGFLLVSHDRYFLDVTVNEVYELFGGALKRYAGNFTHYEKVRSVEIKTLMAEYEKQQEEIAHLEDFIRRFGYKATKAAQAQDRQKRLDKINENRIEIPESLKRIHFSFPPAPHSGRNVVRLTGITKRYGEGRTVLALLDFAAEAGERIVAAGPNGAGKSTLLRIIAGVDNDYTGQRELGAGVAVGYFSQDSAETINGTASVLETVENACPTELVPKARDMLGAFLFRGDDVFKTLDMLSGGEKSRIALLRLLLRPVNLLVLDEPTNHLDMHSKDVLLDALKCFGGTVVFVSHDRGFIESLATRVLEMIPPADDGAGATLAVGAQAGDTQAGKGALGDNKGTAGEVSGGNGGATRVRNFVGGYAYYIERVEKEKAERTAALCGMGNASTAGSDGSGSLRPAGGGKRVAEGGARGEKALGNGSAPAVSNSQQTREERKKADAARRRIEKEAARLEGEISALEEHKKELQISLSESAVYTNGEKCRAIQKEIKDAEAQLDALNKQWEEAAEQL